MNKINELYQLGVLIQNYYLMHLSVALPTVAFMCDLRNLENEFWNKIHDLFNNDSIKFSKNIDSNDAYSKEPKEIIIQFRINKKHTMKKKCIMYIRKDNYSIKYGSKFIIENSNNIDDLKML